MTKKNSPIWTIWNIVVALLFVGLGVLTCAFASNTDFQNTILLITGIILLVIAGLQIIFQVLRIILAGDETTVSADLSIAGVSSTELALGIVVIMVSQNIASAQIVFQYLGYFLGILLVSVGGILIIYEIVFLVRKLHAIARGIITMLVSLIPVALGIVVMVFLSDEKNFLTFFFVCVGILFILIGIGYLALTILKFRKDRALAKAAAENPEEAKAEEPVAEATIAVVVEEPAAEEKAEEPEEKPAEEPEEKPEEPKAE